MMRRVVAMFGTWVFAVGVGMPGIPAGLTHASSLTAGLNTIQTTGGDVHFLPGPCPITVGPSLHVTCGVLTVPENRNVRNGRTVRLQLLTIHASQGTATGDPLVVTDGGPSYNVFSDSGYVDYWANQPFAADHDIIMYNQRGVGFSQPYVGCPELDAAQTAFFSVDALDPMLPKQFVPAAAACHARLVAQGIDLSAYNLEADAADLRDMRIALGYRHWNVLGNSAGGSVALTLMRLYPAGVRSVILDSPLGNQWLGAADALRTQARFLDKVFAGCAENTACASTHPDLRTRFFAEVDKLRAHPVTATVPIDGGAPYEFRMDGAEILWIADSCFDPTCAATLVPVLERAAQGDLPGFISSFLNLVGLPAGLTPFPPVEPFQAQGKTTSMYCRDYVPFEDGARAQAARELPEFREFILSNRFLVPFDDKQTCKRWDVPAADPAQHGPITSSIPTLIMTGEWDGSVGPQTAQPIASHLAHSILVEFPGVGHTPLGWSECPVRVATEFLTAPTTTPDTSCTGQMTEPDFTPQT
jgi:pimeloyl-ACP methyl ester carboxylesterase